MTKGSDKIEMDSFDDSLYKDCTPLFSGTHSFGENYVPILQGLDNLEKHVYFNSPDRSMANPHDQLEGDLSNEGQGLKGDVFPVWKPLQLEENVFLLPQDPWEDNGFQVDEQIPQGGVQLEENVFLLPQDPWEDNGFQVDELIPQGGGVHLETSLQESFQDVLIAEEEAPNGHTNMNGDGLNAHECAVQIHQGLDQPMADTIATGSDHSMVDDDIPPGPSQASEGQEANLLQPRRRRGRPRKLAAPAPQNSLTQDSQRRFHAFNTIFRRPRTKRSGHKNMHWGQWQNHQGLEANLQSRRRRGRPRKLAAPALQNSLTQDSQRRFNTFNRRPRTKRSGHKNMNWISQWKNHQGLDQPMANTIATGSDHSVVDDIPPGPSHASEGQLRRRRGRPRKLAAPALHNSLTRDSSMRPRKRPDFVLPAGWTKKVVPRKNGKFPWRKDSFYIEKATGHQCRSQPEVTKYLELKARQHG